MGNHGAASTRARAGAESKRAPKTTDAKPTRSHLLNLSDWPVSRRLFAVIVMALLMGLIFGGLRVATAESSAAQSGRALQLANLGAKVNSLVLVTDRQDGHRGRPGPFAGHRHRGRFPGEHPGRRRDRA